MRITGWQLFLASALLASGCDVEPKPAESPAAAAPSPSPGTVASPTPTTALGPYSANPDRVVTASGDQDLFSYFCRTVAKKPCDEATIKLFADQGFADGQTAADLALAAVNAQAKLSAPAAAEIADAAFVDALYLTVLERPADDGGKEINVNALGTGAGRKDLVRGFLQSAEFQSRPFP